MQQWRLILSYDGGPFHGWQVQPGLATVQGALADALRQITGEIVLPQGSGRTDTGVHALGQVASFALAAAIPPGNLLRALNRALPPSVRVLRVEHAEPEFHARYSAIGKTYEYRLFVRRPLNPRTAERICPPFLSRYVFDSPHPFDLERANKAAAQVLGEHDFTSFAACDPDLATRHRTQTQTDHGEDGTGQKRGNVRSISASKWHGEPDGAEMVYRVTGSGFLHHMVRNMVGTFLDAGAGRTNPEQIATILAARDRSAAGPTAPARGLFLVEVLY